MRGLSNTQHWPWRVLLWSLWNERPDVRDLLPSQGVKVMHPERDVPLSLYQTLGFAVLWPPSRGERKERPIVGQVETLDRLAGHLHSLFRAQSDFVQPDGIEKQLGCDEAMVRKLMFAFGYVPSRLTAEEAAAQAVAKQAKAAADKADEAAKSVPEDAAAADEDTATAAEIAAPAEEAPSADPLSEVESSESEAPPADEKPEIKADAPVWTRRGRGAGRPSNRPQSRESNKAASGDAAEDKAENSSGKTGGTQGSKGKGPGKGKGKGKGPRPPKSGGGNNQRRDADKPLDPNSPFAVLAQLKK
jgi:hypothetical protein